MPQTEVLDIDGEQIMHEIIHMPSDGSCLFHCIAYCLLGRIDTVASMRVRSDVVNVVCANWPEYQHWTCNETGENYSSIEDYRNDMAQTNTYGAASELKAAALLYRLQFEIFTRGKRIITFGQPMYPIKRIRYFGHAATGHYDVYREITDDSDDSTVIDSTQIKLSKINKH
ncbi:uncharacterized protein LOC119670816 [Teleopsis dalmanni]|uniref:uncharacterized protein LOC119670816 n=1 Tax=Teleopsis dalmanni TaxID=139649 RepID=UPI0018CCC121|nr:uncharacterized protein LOC119670816 [Teleopsis dalmanni]